MQSIPVYGYKGEYKRKVKLEQQLDAELVLLEYVVLDWFESHALLYRT